MTKWSVTSEENYINDMFQLKLVQQRVLLERNVLVLQLFYLICLVIIFNSGVVGLAVVSKCKF